MIVVVDRVSKFFFANPLQSKHSVGVASVGIAWKLLGLLLTFGVPMSIRCDAGGQFTAKVVAHLWYWLRVSLDHGPTDHPRGQGALERMEGWFHEVIAELCKGWPGRRDEYVGEACWSQRTTLDPCPPSGRTPFRIMYGLDAHSNLDGLTPALDGGAFRTGLDNFVAQMQQTFLELREMPKRRQEEKQRRRARHSAAIKRNSSGEMVRIGDKVLVKEADTKLVREGIHAKLVHAHWTGPWQVTPLDQPVLSCQETPRVCRIRKRTVSAANIRVFHDRPEWLRHGFEDEFVQLACGEV